MAARRAAADGAPAEPAAERVEPIARACHRNALMVASATSTLAWLVVTRRAQRRRPELLRRNPFVVPLLAGVSAAVGFGGYRLLDDRCMAQHGLAAAAAGPASGSAAGSKPAAHRGADPHAARGPAPAPCPVAAKPMPAAAAA
ncbi:hypothetical protein CXG81DRAFT_27988 [Caulochytrium protostelioides]|uniref:Uncharacterized protein n=1 Tax=Caulochytrium protostelioides TaxID=1555241 RepID=A0A4P9X2B4_9FUNG|nr:hypothetical protein CXG81DRAFT_27988 [Caulochytrium protostelioides]|eukprot:RKO99238.1 hypothetical protein CXG81DRAFT_27988 [Caulochytrium protostelioides]